MVILRKIRIDKAQVSGMNWVFWSETWHLRVKCKVFVGFLFLPGLHVSFTTLLSSPFAFSTFPLFRLFLHFFQLPALSLFAENKLATVSTRKYTYAFLPISAQQIILVLIISFVNLFFYSGMIFLNFE